MFQDGITFVSKKVLQYAVILLGFGLNLSVILETGKQSLPIIVTTISTSLIIAYLLHKVMHVPGNISTLVGVGSSICGGSAIAATAPVIDADDEEVAQSINLEGEMYVAEVESFTHKCKNQVIVAKKFLSEEDHVLIIDDFLANGCALQGLIQLVTEAGATVEGIGIVIEKGFQSGGRTIRNLGYPLESLAIVEAMDSETGEITFREQ